MNGPKIAKAFWLFSRPNFSRIMPMPCGIIIAEALPCSSREAISSPGFCATAQTADMIVKPVRPIRNIRRRPAMSPSRPPAISSTENDST